jgi:hypothetical protein
MMAHRGFTFGATARGFFIPVAAFFGGMDVAEGGGVEGERRRGRGGQEERDEAAARGRVIRPKRIHFPEHFCCCFSSNLCVLNATNTD